MAVSSDSGHRNRDVFWRRLFVGLSRYDLVLTVIPVSLALALFGYVLFPVSLPGALSAGAAVSTAAVADALFINPPVTGGSDRP